MSLLGEQSTPFNAQIVGNAANVLLTNIPCHSSVISTTVVMMSGGVASHAIASSFSHSNFIGVVEKKVSTESCNIRVAGLTPPIFTGLSEQYEYNLSDVSGGVIMVSIPTDPGTVFVRVGQPFDSMTLLVTKGTRLVRT